MTKRKQTVLFYTELSLLALLLYIIQYNGVFSIAIKNANPMLILSICVCYSMFASELNSVVFALIMGSIADGSASGTKLFFNTVVFMLIAFAVSLLIRYVFNNNYRTAVSLGLICSAAYYILRFVFCVKKTPIQSAISYLLRCSLPSVVYTTVVTFGLYFIVKRLFTKFR